MAKQVPLVDYLVLGDEPHLVARECADCSAKYFDRRNACASCGGDAFNEAVRIQNEGVMTTFTVVGFAAEGIPAPYVASIIDCGGTSVRANVINTSFIPTDLSLGMKVRLATFVAGTDAAGTEAIGFGYEPV